MAFKAQRTAGTHNAKVIAEKLEKEVRRHFEKVIEPTSNKFESIYMVATFLNLKLTCLITTELLPMVKEKLKTLV